MIGLSQSVSSVLTDRLGLLVAVIFVGLVNAFVLGGAYWLLARPAVTFREAASSRWVLLLSFFFAVVLVGALL